MSFNDASCSCQNVGLAKISNFFDDDDDENPMRFSPHKEAKLKEMLGLIPHHIRQTFDQWIRIYVKEAILAHINQETTSLRGACNFESRTLELRFSNNIATPLLTGDHIKGVGGVPITLTLVDSRTKEEVKSGPEAAGTVKIVVLDAEVDGVTGEDGRKEIENVLVRQMEGNKFIRVTSLCLDLVEGKALLPVVSFARNKRWMRISNFRLEAKFVDNFNGVQVKKARTDTFVLKDCRTAAYRNHHLPSLLDDVWRLKEIGRKSPLARSLRQEKIKTVGDFLVRLFQHPQCLEEIFDRAKRAKSLKVTVKHARKCPAKLKYCFSFDRKTEVVFNVSGEVLGLYLHGQFLSTDILSETQKEVAENLIISAFENWGNVISIGEDEFLNLSSSNPGGHGPAKTESVTPCINTLATFDKNVFLDGLDLYINESSLFGNVLYDGQPQFLPEPLRTRYNEIYCGFENICISNRLEPEPVSGSVGTFTIGSSPTRSLDDIHAHKKPRLSQCAM